MHIELNNLSHWQEDRIRRLVSSVAKNLKLRRDVRFVFQTTWTEIDDYGDIVPGSEAEVGFDGDAYDNGVVRVCIDKSMQFPFTYDINEQLEGFYLRHIVQFKNAQEMLLYMTAHELRHLYQWENPLKAKQIRRLLRCDDETDADIYATMTLSRHRSGKL
jgi:phage-related protein